MAGLPHGVGSCVSLIEGLRFHAAVTGGRQAALAGALGWAAPDNDGDAFRATLSALLEDLGVPTRLGDCAITADDQRRVAEHMLAESPTLGTLDELVAGLGRMG